MKSNERKILKKIIGFPLGTFVKFRFYKIKTWHYGYVVDPRIFERIKDAKLFVKEREQGFYYAITDLDLVEYANEYEEKDGVE